jgi:glycosyltransferase involved in cell wall biosynthesis
MRHVLLVAYYFPPLGGAGSLRVSGFATHLPEYGWEPTVLAPRNGAYHRDPSLRFPEDRVIRSASFELSRIGKRLLRVGGDDIRPARVAGWRSALRNGARQFLYYPDAQIGWFPAAWQRGREALRRTSFDSIFSSSPPVTAHLIARRLHREMSIPWVADFRDPWSEFLPPGSLVRRRAARLERSVAQTASEVVMTSPSYARWHAAKWNRSVTVITNGHDGEHPRCVASPSRFTLAYLGSYYPSTQDLTGVWAAIRRLAAAGSPGVDSLLFIGDLPPALRAELANHGLDGLVEVAGFLPHAEAIARLRASSALLVAGPRSAEGVLRGQITAKLFEYLATERPIVYVGDPASDAAELLRRYPGCYVSAADDVDGIVKALIRSNAEQEPRNVDDLSRRKLTARLADLLEVRSSN